MFDDANQSSAFQVPAWFGKEVTEEAAFDRPALAIQGVPSVGEMLLSNAALDAVLDIIEPRFGFGRYGSTSRSPESGEGLNSPLRRPAAAIPAPEAPRPAPAPTPEPEAIAPVAPVALPPPAPEPAPAPVTPVAAEPAHQEEVPAEETTLHEAPRAEEPVQNKTTANGGSPAEAVHGDARIDDVIESLSAALGAAIQQNPAQQPEKQEDPGAVFERWTVRPRRTQNQG